VVARTKAVRWCATLRFVARVIALSLSLVTLVLARFGVPASVLISAVVLSLAILYVLDSRSGGFGLWASYVLSFVLFAHLRTLADDTGVPIRGHYALEAEKGLFGGTVPTEWLQHRLYTGSAGALEIACLTVYASYFLVPHLLALDLWRKDPASFMRYGLSVLFAVYVGLAVSFAVPTSPPWLADRFAGGPHLARLLTDAFGHNPERAGAHSGVAGTNPFAAMPSLHMAVTTLVVLALWRRPVLRWFAITYLATMAFTLVYTGEHYVVDELAGVLTALLAWATATRLVDGSPIVRRVPVSVKSRSKPLGASGAYLYSARRDGSSVGRAGDF
jgi:PAP2 superfamily protein